MSSHSREAAQLAWQLEAEGFTVRIIGSGHYEVRHQGRRVTTFSHSPKDRRWRANALQYIRAWKKQNAAGILPAASQLTDSRTAKPMAGLTRSRRKPRGTNRK